MLSSGSPFIGQVLDARFELKSVAGRGQFSTVFEAFDRSNDLVVAIKMLHQRRASELIAVAEFETEGDLLDRLTDCQNIINYSGTYATSVDATLAGIPMRVPVRFHVLEYAEGSLADLLPDRAQFSWSLRLQFFREAVLGTHQMHLRNVMHRDVKCSNALLVATRRQDEYVVKLGDLGRSRALNEAPRLAPTSYLMGRGDPDFAPPEYIWKLGATDLEGLRRADLYLLGSLLFELATGHGFTTIAFPNEWLVAGASPTISYADRIATLRGSAEAAIEVFGRTLPNAIRQPASALLRQLCDPDPSRRELRFRAEAKLPLVGVEWVLRRTDILLRTLAIERRAVHSSTGDKK
jgi:serine/threonine protein kinase